MNRLKQAIERLQTTYVDTYESSPNLIPQNNTLLTDVSPVVYYQLHNHPKHPFGHHSHMTTHRRIELRTTLYLSILLAIYLSTFTTPSAFAQSNQQLREAISMSFSNEESSKPLLTRRSQQQIKS